jgi:hypothetical protein
MYQTYTPQVLGRLWLSVVGQLFPTFCYLLSPQPRSRRRFWQSCTHNTLQSLGGCTNLSLKSLFEERRRLRSVLSRQVDRIRSSKEFSKLPHKLARCQGQSYFVSDIEGYKIPRRKPCARDLGAYCAELPLYHQADPGRVVVPQLCHSPTEVPKASSGITGCCQRHN